MSDTAIAALVALLSGILIAGLFFGWRNKKRKARMEIERYCREQGYLCSHEDSSLEHVLEVKSDGFVLQSRETSQYHDAQTGSDSWQREILLRSKNGGEEPAGFILGTIQSSLAWDRIPGAMQSQILQKLGLAVQPGAYQGAPELIKIKNGTLLLFNPSGQLRKQKLERIADELSKWPIIQGLTIKADGKEFAIRLTNATLKSSSDIERLIRLGQIVRDEEAENN